LHQKVEVVGYDDLGAEALRRIDVQDFQVTVVNDIYGGDLYEEGRVRFRIADQLESNRTFLISENFCS
jgi:fumarate hydratase subunit beta